jgi:hypothetical protein
MFVSKYAGGVLPEPTRAHVRGFIFHLPQTWASAARCENVTPMPMPTCGRGSVRSARRANTVGFSPCPDLPLHLRSPDSECPELACCLPILRSLGGERPLLTLILSVF